MDLAELRQVDLKDLARAPLSAKVGVIAVLCAAIAGAGYWFDTSKQFDQLEKIERAEGELRQKFEIKQKKAANLDLYKQQLAEMRQTFGTMLRQLPSKTELPGLIVDISQTGLASGLEIELFKPGNEVNKDFYAEKPIQIRVQGGYHELGEFVSGVAGLPRIVTLHNIELSPGKEGNPMTMSATAKTYRYLEDAQ